MDFHIILVSKAIFFFIVEKGLFRKCADTQVASSSFFLFFCGYRQILESTCNPARGYDFFFCTVLSSGCKILKNRRRGTQDIRRMLIKLMHGRRPYTKVKRAYVHTRKRWW